MPLIPEGLLGIRLHWHSRDGKCAGLRHGRAWHVARFLVLSRGVVVRPVPQLAQCAVELQLVAGQQLSLHAFWRRDIWCAGGDQQRMG